MATTMQKKTNEGTVVRSTLEYLGVDPDSRAARMRLYGRLVGFATLTATAVGAGAIYLKGMALIW